jgi:hypothetical protein
MTRESIAQALESEGLGAGNQGYTIPEARDASFLIGAPGGVYSIDRVVRVDLRDKLLLVENAKHERFFFGYDDVLGVRLLAAPTTRTGFAR